MLRVCAGCNSVLGCYIDGVRYDCDICDRKECTYNPTISPKITSGFCQRCIKRIRALRQR